MSSATRAVRRRPRGLLAACAVATLAAAVVPGTGRPAAAASPVRIMPIGDSITEGSDGSVTYRRFLWLQLAAAGHRVDFVGTRSGVRDGVPKYTDFDQDHDGHAGW